MSEPTWKDRVAELAHATTTCCPGANHGIASKLRAYTTPELAGGGVAAYFGAEVLAQLENGHHLESLHFELLELAAKAFLACCDAARAGQEAN